jgi:hypothetical protein
MKESSSQKNPPVVQFQARCGGPGIVQLIQPMKKQTREITCRIRVRVMRFLLGNGAASRPSFLKA